MTGAIVAGVVLGALWFAWCAFRGERVEADAGVAPAAALEPDRLRPRTPGRRRRGGF